MLVNVQPYCYQWAKEVFSNTFWISPNSTPWARRTPGICDQFLIIIWQLTQSVNIYTFGFKCLILGAYQLLVFDHFLSTIFFDNFLFFSDQFIWKQIERSICSYLEAFTVSSLLHSRQIAYSMRRFLQHKFHHCTNNPKKNTLLNSMLSKCQVISMYI